MEIRTKHARAENHGGKRAEIGFLVIHFTANRWDTAKNNADYFAREVTRTSAHYFVDENEVWQSVPDDVTAWHCGGQTYYHAACRNANSIGIEICMHDRQGALRQGSIDRAAALARMLMEKYDIPAEHVLRHYDVTHKDCPAPMVEDPARWEAFRTALRRAETAPAGWAKAAWEKAAAAGIVDGTRPTEPVTRQELAVILTASVSSGENAKRPRHCLSGSSFCGHVNRSVKLRSEESFSPCSLKFLWILTERLSIS